MLALALAPLIACSSAPVPTPAGEPPGPPTEAASADTTRERLRGPGAPAAPTGHDTAQATAYLAVGGGSWPESTEVSLEQDLLLFQEVFGAGGEVLFAGGDGSRSVRVLREPTVQRDLPQEAQVRRDLGDLFAPRQGRGSVYREGRLRAGAATGPALADHLSRALQASESQPLTCYVATHGDQGEGGPADNRILLWGGDELTAAELAELHDGKVRPLHLIITSCFSGGFAELAFAAADAGRGLATAPRCGLFAGTWDRETSGCDPNPERREQESYSIHMLNALRGRDRHGEPVALAALDLDDDGHINGLEAHARARIASRSLDVPTTTSERYLREVQRVPSPTIDTSLVEELAVRDRLAVDLRIADRAAADARYLQLEHDMRGLDTALERAAKVEERAYLVLAEALLRRYPVLDDPFHPQFEPTLRENLSEIQALLNGDPKSLAHRQSQQRLQELDARYAQLQQEQAVLLRYLRADETLHLAGALRTAGGEAYAGYLSLVRCERSIGGQRVKPR